MGVTGFRVWLLPCIASLAELPLARPDQATHTPGRWGSQPPGVYDGAQPPRKEGPSLKRTGWLGETDECGGMKGSWAAINT